jgi:hypothetical protein
MRLKNLLIGTGIILSSLLPATARTEEHRKTEPRFGIQTQVDSQINGNMGLGLYFSPYQYKGLEFGTNLGLRTENKFPGRASTLIGYGASLEYTNLPFGTLLGTSAEKFSSGFSQYPIDQETGSLPGITGDTNLDIFRFYVGKKFQFKGDQELDVTLGLTQKNGRFTTTSIEEIENPYHNKKFKEPAAELGIKISF